MHDTPQDWVPRTLVFMPAYNEEASLPPLLQSLHTLYPGLDVLVVNDCSDDRTSLQARAVGAAVLDLPRNLGVAGAVQAGLRYAYEHGYDYAIRCDADGQHPAACFTELMGPMLRDEADLVIGARDGSLANSLVRTIGIKYLSLVLSHICKARVTDPTSGLHVFNRMLMCYFAAHYPADYPEPESLALIRRQGYRFLEVPVAFQPRLHGTSSLNAWSSVYYAVKVSLSLLVDRARVVDPRYARANLIGQVETR